MSALFPPGYVDARARYRAFMDEHKKLFRIPLGDVEALERHYRKFGMLSDADPRRDEKEAAPCPRAAPPLLRATCDCSRYRCGDSPIGSVAWSALLCLALWAAAGGYLTSRTFKWE